MKLSQESGKISRLVVFLLACVLFAAAGGYLVFSLLDWFEQPQVLAQPQVIEYPSGTTLKELSRRLAQKGVINHPKIFELWVRLIENYSRFQAGTYRFEGSVSPAQIIEIISQGKIYLTYALELTIPECFTYRQIAAELVKKGVGSKNEFDALMHDVDYLRSLNVPSSSLEGFLYPATYRFPAFPTAREAISTAVKKFWSKLPREYENNVGHMGLSLQKAVTFASLIEAETPLDDEKPLISEVIWNRLRMNTPLGIDAAIIYGIDDYQGDIKKKHLNDASNPYNTRLRHGLPPTPICSPSEISLQAVLTPSQHGYIYYVLNTDPGRYHHFSRTAEEHLAYQKKLVEAQSKSTSVP